MHAKGCPWRREELGERREEDKDEDEHEEETEEEEEHPVRVFELHNTTTPTTRGKAGCNSQTTTDTCASSMLSIPRPPATSCRHSVAFALFSQTSCCQFVVSGESDT